MSAHILAARKVAMLGDFAVGKTSLVARAVRNTFSDNYLTTIGVKVDSKALQLEDGRALRLVLWDIAGAGALDQVRASYLGGAHGFLLVADGTRADTVDTALRLHEQGCRLLGKTVPAVLLLNKCDLAAEWELSVQRMEMLSSVHEVRSVSARSGQGVEDALVSLGARL